MRLSIIIVNYNVKYFLDQCLHSVYNALKGIEAEVFVVDNNSVDSSCTMIKEKYPQVKLLENKKNLGFSKANNQALRQAKGEYLLMLNPDTVVQEDSFTRCIEFMDANPEAGALGVKMIDGKGNFLPESKRALPTPSVAFFKVFGFSSIFPKSKKFGRYHLSYLDKDKTHEVEILSGAYMFIRKVAIDKTGLLDEDFFMYGEDIDISYRIIKAGYRNYYFSGTTIIHYKGESTKKGSVNYVIVFYNAMLIFARKHFSKKNARLFSFLINIAIYFRASLAILIRFLKSTWLPATDACLMYVGYMIIRPWWESIKFSGNLKYPREFFLIILPAYIVIWLIGLTFAGAYGKPVKIGNLLKGICVATITILAIYGLLPLNLRYSRALIILGTLWDISVLTGFRLLLHALNVKGYRLGNISKKRIILIGSEGETKRVSDLLTQTLINPEILGFLSNEPSPARNYLGRTEQLEDVIDIYKADEIVFCARNLPAQEIIDKMLELSHIDVEFKIAPPESLSIIGSNSINTAGDLYLINLNTINKSINKRNKRLIDLLASMVILIIFPALMFFIKNKKKAFANIFKVLSGRFTWVGYYVWPGLRNGDLPKIKPGVLSPVDGLSRKDITPDLKEKINVLYAKDYKFINDINIIWRGLLSIGR